MRHALDLTRYRWRQQHGDITAFGTWFGEKERRPAIVLVPSYSEGYEKTTPCVVPIDAAWLWAERLGDARHAARASYEFARHLGLENSVLTCMRITDIIRGHLGDLLTMPPEPVEKVAVADAVLTHASGRQTHREVLDRV